MVVAFPMLTHAAVALREPTLEWLALVDLVAIPLLRPLADGQPRAWALFAALAALAYGLTRIGGGAYALYLPSLAVPALLAWVFGSSLRHGRIPLVTRIADAARGGLTPALRLYTRRLTQMWTGLFLAMVASALLLLLAGRADWWSLVTNFINYAATAVIVLFEYLYRRLRFPDYDHPGFIEYLGILVRSSPRAG